MRIECLGDVIEYKNKTYPCSISLAMNLVGGKWKILILYHINNGITRFGQLYKCLVTITEATLSHELKQLEKEGLIKKQLFGTKPPLVSDYTLTEFGKSFLPILNAIMAWGNQIALEKGKFISYEKSVSPKIISALPAYTVWEFACD